MTTSKAKSLQKKINKYGIEKQGSLSSFVKIIEDFRIIPDNENDSLQLFSFKGHEVIGKRINGVLTLNLKQLSVYIEGNYNTITKAFQRNEFQEGRHYFRGGGQNVDPVNLTLRGVLKLLRHTNVGFALAFYDEVCDLICDNINPLTMSQELLRQQQKELNRRIEYKPPFDYYSLAWKMKRVEILDKANNLCEYKFEGCTVYATDVHHRNSAGYAEIALEDWNLKATCVHCHELITKKKKEDER